MLASERPRRVLVSLAYLSQLPAAIDLVRFLDRLGVNRAVGGSLPRSLAATGAGLDLATWIEAAMLGTRTGAYRFSQYLTGDRRPKTDVDTVVLCTPPATRLPRDHENIRGPGYYQ